MGERAFTIGSWITEPRAESRVEERHQERDERRRVISSVGTRGRTRNRDGCPKRDALTVELLLPHLFGHDDLVRLRMRAGAAITNEQRARMQRRDRKRRRLALLPREVGIAHDV